MNSYQRNDITYRIAYGETNLKKPKHAETVSNILSNFELEESSSSEYKVQIISKNHRGYDNTGVTIDSSFDNLKLSKKILSILVDLKVIQTKQTNVKPTGICGKVLKWLINLLFCALFILTCSLNLPFFVIHVPFALIPCVFCFCAVISSHRRFHILFCYDLFFLTIVLLQINKWRIGAISIGIYMYITLWPILLHFLLLFVLKLDYGVISLPIVIWEKIDIGLLGIFHRFFNIIARKKSLRILWLFLKVCFTLVHIPLIILYYTTFLFSLLYMSCNKCVIFLAVFYTNFILATGFFITGGLLLVCENTCAMDLDSLQNHTIAVMFILISFYIFFFLCVCNMYCWTELDMKYGLLTSQCEAVDNCLCTLKSLL